MVNFEEKELQRQATATPKHSRIILPGKREPVTPSRRRGFGLKSAVAYTSNSNCRHTGKSMSFHGKESRQAVCASIDTDFTRYVG